MSFLIYFFFFFHLFFFIFLFVFFSIFHLLIIYLLSVSFGYLFSLSLLVLSVYLVFLLFIFYFGELFYRNFLYHQPLYLSRSYYFTILFHSLVKNCNHKGLGIYYLLSGFIFGISGTLISVLMRIELYSSGNRIISPENQNFYNVSITLHGLLMIFFLVMPGLFGGFGNYFVPIFQGSPEVVYPRVNNFSILILLLSYLFLILSIISEFGGGTG